MTGLNRRHFLGLAGAAVSAVTLGACAGTGGSGGDAAEGEPGTINFWSNHPGLSKDIEIKLGNDFAAANSGTKVNVIDAGANYEEVAQKFNAALSGGELPDVLVISDVTWFNLALNEAITPLDSMFSAAGVQTEDYVDSLFADYKFKDQHFALPYARSTPLFYYNKSIWKAAGLPDRGPSTWQEFAEWGTKLESQGSKGALAISDGTDYLDWYFQGMIWSFGGSYSQEWKPTFTEPKSIEAGKFLQKLFTDKHMRVATEPSSDFAAGIASSFVDSTGALGGLTKTAKFEFGTAFLPGPKGVLSCPTGGGGLAIPAGISDERKELALKFINFITSTENTVTFSQGTGYMPARKSALKDPKEVAYLKANPNAKTAVEQLPFTKSQDYARVFVPGGGLRIGAGLDRIARGEDVEKVFGELSAETQKVTDRDITPKL
jgi:sn-glycerol 3-phosphate transport system substrate-binding protein